MARIIPFTPRDRLEWLIAADRLVPAENPGLPADPIVPFELDIDVDAWIAADREERDPS